MTQLERGVEILQWTCNLHPTSKNRALLQGATKLLANAKASAGDMGGASSETQQPSLSPLWNEWLGAMAPIGAPVSIDGLGGESALGMGMGLDVGAGGEIGVEAILGMLDQSGMW